MDHVGERAEAEPAHHRERDLVQHLARVPGDDGRAEDAVGALLHVHLDEALLLAVGDGAVDGGERRHEGVDGDVLPRGVALVHPDVRDLRIGVGAPGHVQRAQLLAAEEEGVLDHDACGRIGHVRELVLHADVARGVDARVRGLQAVVHHHAARRVVLDADRFEAEPLDVGRAARADQDLVDRDLPRRELDHPPPPPKRSAVPSTATVSGPVKRASPRKTSTPSSCWKRSAESWWLMRARSRRMRSITALKSGSAPSRSGTPSRAASRTSPTTREERITHFDGTQPTFKQSPPIRYLSTRATRAPSPAAPAAVTRPAVPAPITTRL